MTYAEYINFYIQIRDQLDEYMMNDFSGKVTLDNIYNYFFDELENHVFQNKTSLEVLTSILEENNIYLEKIEGKITKNHSNFKKVREFLKVEEQKCRYEILKINLKNYFVDDTTMDESSLLNYGVIIDDASKNIEEYEEIVLYDCEDKLTLDESIKLVKDFFVDIDKSGELSSSFEDFLIDENVFLWNREDKQKYEQLKNSKFAKCCPYYDFRMSFVSKIDNELFVNVYCEGNILDCYSIIHEFIHYYTIKETVDEEESECSKFFAEFPSIFFEYLFNLYLEEQELFEADRDIEIEERKVENLKNIFLASAFYKLHKINVENGIIDFDNFYNDYVNSREFKNFEAKALDVYRILNDEIYETDRFCDLLNVNLAEFEYFNIIEYINATLLSEELIKLIRNGKTYLIDRMINIMKSLTYTKMDPTYIISYLELYYRFYDFKPISENVNPKRLEKIM